MLFYTSLIQSQWKQWLKKKSKGIVKIDRLKKISIVVICDWILFLSKSKYNKFPLKRRKIRRANNLCAYHRQGNTLYFSEFIISFNNHIRSMSFTIFLLQIKSQAQRVWTIKSLSNTKKIKKERERARIQVFVCLILKPIFFSNTLLQSTFHYQRLM